MDFYERRMALANRKFDCGKMNCMPHGLFCWLRYANCGYGWAWSVVGCGEWGIWGTALRVFLPYGLMDEMRRKILKALSDD